MLQNEVLMRLTNLIIIILFSYNLSSCMPVAFTAIASTTIASAKDRSFGDTIDDLTIATKIKKEFISKGFKKLYARVYVEVVQGRVLLTGSVETEEDIIKSVEIAWSIYGVREVINEIKITDDAHKFNTTRYAKDSWITTRINSSIFFKKDIKFANYTAVTHDGVVYLFGIARTENELQSVTKIASEISGVKKVVSHVHLREEMSRKFQNPEEIISKDNYNNEFDDEFEYNNDEKGFKY